MRIIKNVIPTNPNKMCCSWKVLCKVKALQKSDKYFFRNCIHRFSNKQTLHFKSLEWNYMLNADEKLHEELELKIDFHNYVCLQDICVYFDPTRCIHRIKIALTRFLCFLMFSSQQKSFHFQNNQMEFCFGEPMQTDWKAKLLRSLFRAFNTSSIQLRLMVTRAVH